MTRPRPFLRSLVAATCGTTLLAAAVLGTGAAAFAEEAPEPVTATAEPATDAAAAEPITPAEEPAASEATDPVVDPEPATEPAPADEAAADEPVVEPAPEAGAPAAVDTSTERAAATASAAPSAEVEITPLSEVVVPDETAPQVVVTVPRSVGLGTELKEITFTADPETEPVVQLTLSEATAEILGFVEFQELQGGKWVDVDFEETRRGSTYTFRVIGGEAKLRVGVSQESYERDWQLFLDAFSALAEDDGPDALDFIDFTTELVHDGPGDSQLRPHRIALVTPEIQVAEAAPDEVEAGDSFTFSYRITNRTGSDYPSNASLDLLEFGTLTVEGEDYVVDAADMALTCSVDGRTPVVVDMEEVDYPFMGPAGSLPLVGLSAGASIDVECQVDLAGDLPESELELLPLLTLGESRAPLTDLGDAAQTITILEWSEPAPAPQPTKPAPAQPAPVPTPTAPSNPPAAAPVRQVPATALPRTGTDPLPLAAAGLGLVLAGAAALLGGRRRAHN